MIRTALLVSSLLLAGCTQPVTSSFEPAAAPATSQSVRIGRLRGPSNRASRSLRDALRASLARNGVAVVRGRGPGIVELSGRLASLNEGNVTTYTWEWRLERGGRAVARPIVGFERAAGGSSNQWGGLGGHNAARIAERVGRKVALALARAR